MQHNPMEMLRAAVYNQSGPVRGWHIDYLSNHARRYLADLAIIEKLAPRGTILELGSVPCHMTALLKCAGHAVVGVDANPERVGEFSRQFDLEIRRCDIERSPLPIADGSVACVLLCETFEHLRIDPAFVLSEINRVLAVGAPLLLTTPNVYSLPSIARFLLGRSIADPWQEYSKLRSLGHMGHVREYSAGEVSRFLNAAGFAIASLDYRYYRSPDPGWKRGLLQLAYRIVPRRFRRDIVIVARKAREGLRLEALVPE